MTYSADEQRVLDFAALLRDRSRWPAGFTWDYSSCATCAMGLFCAIELGDPKLANRMRDKELFSKMFGKVFTPTECNDICYYANIILADQGIMTPSGNVTPEHVALLIEQTIARKHETKS